MPSYTELMLAELQQQRSEQSRQHGELLSAIAHLTQATQRLEAALAQLQAQAQPQSVAQTSAPAQAQAQGVAQAEAQAQAQGEAQTPPPAEILQSRAGLGRWVGQLFGGVKNAAKAILGKSAT
jgi:septal ring factor EnvC (AmiA/AmiB activator)